MAERTTKVSLVAEVSGYVAGMEKAAKKTRELGTEAEKLADKRDAIAGLGVGLVAIGAVAAAAVGIAVAKFAEFDQAISNVKAATQESAENMDLLREAALQAGATSVFSATEAANAIEALGKAGLTTQQILDGGLNGALSLAAAGQLGVAEAAEIAAISVKQFNLAGGDVPHVADLLAAGAGKAVGDVTDLAAALGQAGLVANQTGLSIEDTTGVLAAFADKGLLGSDAGTSLKTMLQSLAPSSKQAKEEMDKLGISAFDAGGQFIGIEKFAGNYKDALSKLTPEQQAASSKIIFGSDAVRAANVLYDLGAEGIKKYVDQTNESGYAARVAADRLNNLTGDVEALGGAFDSAVIKTGSGANDILRGITQTATGLIGAIGALPTPVLNLGLGLGGVVAAVGLVGGGALLAVPKIAAFKGALEALNVSGRKAALGIGVASIALTAFTVVLGIVAAKQAEAVNEAQEFQASLDQGSGAVTNYTRDLVAKKLAEKGAFDGAKRAGISQQELTDAVIKGGSALADVNKKIRDSGTFLDAGKGNALNATRELSEGLKNAKQGLEDVKAAGESAADGSEKVQDFFTESALTADDYAVAMQGVVDGLRDYGSAAFDVEGSTDSFYASLDDLNKLLADGGANLDQTTEKGRETSGALLDTAKATNDFAAATLNAGGSTEEVQGILEAGRQKIIETRIALGDTEEAARAYADQLVKTPKQLETEAKLTGLDKAAADLQSFIDRASGRTITINAALNERVAGATSRGGITYADGGAVHGPGSGTSDSISARLSNGEHVLTAAEVARMGGQAAVYRFRSQLTGSPKLVPASNHYAAGGAVSGGSGLVGITFVSGAVQIADVVRTELQFADGRRQQVISNGKRVR